MGWTFEGVRFEVPGDEEPVTDGNNVAWKCPSCQRPLLFVYQNGRIGSGPGRPAACECGASYFLDPPYQPNLEPPAGVRYCSCRPHENSPTVNPNGDERYALHRQAAPAIAGSTLVGDDVHPAAECRLLRDGTVGANRWQVTSRRKSRYERAGSRQESGTGGSQCSGSAHGPIVRCIQP